MESDAPVILDILVALVTAVTADPVHFVILHSSFLSTEHQICGHTVLPFSDLSPSPSVINVPVLACYKTIIFQGLLGIWE